jgi:hypothetical protein
MIALVALLLVQSAAAGSTIDLGGRKATVRTLDAPPFVESDYTKRFKFDSFDNPKLRELREKYRLDDVVAPGKDEFEKQLLLVDWVHAQFKKFGRPSSEARGALDVLKAVGEGHTFFCAQYAQVLVSAAASLGWVDRPIALRRHQDGGKGGAREHTTTEIWSNQHRKWIMVDPTFGLHLLKDGVPLNSYEIRTEWFYNEGRDLAFVMGKDRKAYRKADLPVFLARFPGYGDLDLSRDELDKYGFTGYVPNTNLMDSGSDYGGMFIVKDKLCDGTKWHERVNPANPAVDPYFPIGQAAPSLAAEGGKAKVTLRTLTPNFKEYQVRLDRGEWAASEATLLWGLRPGLNRLEARTVNRFGVPGPVSVVELEVFD